MAFQDFDIINERRRQERRKKIQKRILIGLVSTILLVCIIGAAAYVGLNSKSSGGGGSDHGKSPSKPSHQPTTTSASASASTNTKALEASSKIVKVICEAAEYKDKCESSLGDAVKNDPNAQPKDLLKYSIKLAQDEVGKAFDKTTSMKFESEMDKGAYEDCKQLFDDAKEELGFSISEITADDLKKLSTKAPDLNNWLSAAISYHQTCIDGFPEGELKTQLKDVFKDSQEFVSNSLSIVTAVSTVLSAVQSVLTRHLLSEKNGSATPSWVNSEDRRILKAADDKPTPNVTVAKDGSGNFKTVSEALAAIPEKYDGRYVVYVKEGIYEETVTVTKKMENMTMYGDGSQKSIITGSKNFVDGVRTFQTATFVVLGNGFLGKAMGFRNTAGPEKHQAVAARVQADRAMFVNCRFEGYQDTLYAQTHRQFYRSCVISGTVDFIFGDAAAIFQNCIMTLRKPMDNQQNIVTAQGRYDQKETTGFVLQKCDIKADDKLAPDKDKIRSYLGRPWKEYSRTIVMESDIGDVIHPDGWLPWEGDFALKTLFYGEFNNTGPGASTNARVNWVGRKVLSRDEASKFTVGTFLDGAWFSGRGVPTQYGLYN
ncbi:putative pectinesterase/pectinesterase inhibitor 45 [Arachis ipaensis]|nr:putative pectinesterase/pectinesterase inhibitor 45 [Arachis ipaensis]XP_025644635.1 putative pectinesterase/pectinesterase inhibitor 45 [Arachis hypogaea]